MKSSHSENSLNIGAENGSGADDPTAMKQRRQQAKQTPVPDEPTTPPAAPEMQADAMGSPSGDAAASPARPPFPDTGAPAADGMSGQPSQPFVPWPPATATRPPDFGGCDISWLSNGTSTPQGAGTPQPSGQKRTASTPPTGAPLRHGRSQSPWPVPNLRVVHQRVEMPDGDSAVNVIVAALVKQHEHDRDFIDQLKDTVISMHDRLMAHDRQISRWRSWSEDSARKLLELESRAQQSSATAVEAMREEMNKEFKTKFPGVLNELVDERVRGAEAKIKEIEAKLLEHRAAQGETAVYLQCLHQERPQEGQTLLQAFQWVEGQLEELKRGAADTDLVKKIMREESQNFMTAVGHEMQGIREHAQAQTAAISVLNSGFNYLNKAVAEMNAQHAEIKVEVQAMRAAASCTEPPARAPPGCGGAGAQAPRNCAYGCAGCGFNSAPPLVPGLARPGGRGGPTGGAYGAGGPPSGHDGHAASPNGHDPPTPACFLKSRGGNGECHCVHVVTLMAEMAEVKVFLGDLHGDGHERRIPGMRLPAQAPAGPAMPGARPHDPSPTERTLWALPLKLGPMGTLSSGKLFDDRVTGQDGFRFTGAKGGEAWKGKVERYLISKIPALHVLMGWAERYEGVIEEAKLHEAVQDQLTVYRHDGSAEDMLEVLNGGVWGFLSNCLSGEAETMFKQAKTLHGIDAWRRVVRFIDHGKSIRLETLRNEVRLLHTKQIRNLEGVAIGLAEFENKLQEFTDLGGLAPEDADKKSDLLAILPQEMKELMIWRATDPEEPYQKFRDRVQTQTAQILLNRKKLPLHAVQQEEEDDEDDFYADPATMTREELVAVVGRLGAQGRLRQGPGRRFDTQRRTGAPGAAPPPRDPRDRPPRKCANCGEPHPGACTKARVATADRLCWGCGKPGHTSNNCPAKAAQRPGAVKAVADAPGRVPVFGLGNDGPILHTDREGFQQVRQGGRPRPRAPVLGDFLSRNSFDPLCAVYDKNEDSPQPKARAAFSTADPLGSRERSRAPADEPVTAKPSGAGSIQTTMPSSHGDGTQTVEKAMFPSLKEALGEVEQALHEEELCAASATPGHATLLAEMQALIPEKWVGLAHAPGTRMAKIAQAGPSRPTHLLDADEMDLLEDQEGPDEQINVVQSEIRARVAMDSGAVSSVTHPATVPHGTVIAPNTSGKHFVGAGGDTIIKHGKCTTMMTGAHGPVGCNWQVADVTRPLNSVSQITGSYDGPGEHDVLFNNKTCVVVPPGVVNAILEKIKPIAEYPREASGLYVADVVMSSFTRQGQHE